MAGAVQGFDDLWIDSEFSFAEIKARCPSRFRLVSASIMVITFFSQASGAASSIRYFCGCE